MTLHDQHVHSKYSADSNQILEPYIKKAIDKGCKYFVTTDHLDFDLTEFKEDWTVDYEGLKKELKEYQYIYPNITFLLGIEFGYRRDHLDKINNQLDSENFDLVNMSIHDVKGIDFYWSKYFIENGIEETINKYFDEMIYATETFDNFDVLSHIDYGFKTIYEMDNTYVISKYEDKINRVLKNLIAKWKALEINTKVQETINNDNHVRYILRLYKSLGGKNLTLSSDSHSVNRYLSSFDKYKQIIKEEGFDYLVYFIKRKMYTYSI